MSTVTFTDTYANGQIRRPTRATYRRPACPPDALYSSRQEWPWRLNNRASRRSKTLSLLSRILGRTAPLSLMYRRLRPVLIDLITDHVRAMCPIEPATMSRSVSWSLITRVCCCCCLTKTNHPTRVANLLLAHGVMGKEGGTTTHDSDRFTPNHGQFHATHYVRPVEHLNDIMQMQQIISKIVL